MYFKPGKKSFFMKILRLLTLILLSTVLFTNCKKEDETYKVKIRVLKNQNLAEDSLVLVGYKVLTNYQLNSQETATLSDNYKFRSGDTTFYVLITNSEGYAVDDKAYVGQKTKEFEHPIILDCKVYGPKDENCEHQLGQAIVRSEAVSNPSEKKIYIDIEKLKEQELL